MADTETWQERYKRAVLSYVILHGDAQPAPGAKAQPWDNGIARDNAAMQEHLGTCQLDLAACTMLEDTHWYEWGGTFSSDKFCTGYRVGITCACGGVRDRHWRLEPENLAELINSFAA